MGRVDILSASAGSGKTHSLAYNYLKILLEEPANYRHILAVTFTNKATDELKGRILQELNKLSKGLPSRFDKNLAEDKYDMALVRKQSARACNLILHDYNNFAVMTIDKFFQRIMRAFIKELGKDLNFNLEIKTDSLLEQAADRLLEDIAGNNNLYQWVLHYIGVNLAENKSWDIKKAVVELGSQLFNEEFKYSGIKSDDKEALAALIGAVTVKAKALAELYKSTAREFIALMDEHGLVAGDFTGGERSGVCVYIGHVAAGELTPPSPAAHKALEGNWHKKGDSITNQTIDSISAELHEIVARLVELYRDVAEANSNKAALATYYRDFALLADMRQRIDDLCSEEEILPLSDVGQLIAELVQGNDAPFIYEKAGNRFDYFMIDEFQDTSTMQWRNFVPLLHNALAQSEGNPVLLVGDVKQSIYRWRGGDWSLLAKGVSREFDDVSRTPMSVNWRSTQSVINFNNALTLEAVNTFSARIKKQLDEGLAQGFLSQRRHDELERMLGDAYENHNQSIGPNAAEGYVTVTAFSKESPAPHPAIARIEELQSRGFRASDIAILVRSNREAEEIATMLLNYKNDPNRDHRYIFDVVTQEALKISSSPGVQFVTACMGLAASPDSNLSRALFNSYFERPFECEIPEDDKLFLASLSMLHPEEVFNEIMLHFPKCCTPGEMPYIQALHSQIIEFCSRNIADTALFMKWWQEVGREASVALPDEADAITIITIHKAKGLGFPAVIIPYCNWSTAPLTNGLFWATPNEPFDELGHVERYPVRFNSTLATSNFSESYYNELTLSAIDAINTLYVAITRAEHELHIMFTTEDKSGAVSNPVAKHTGLDTEIDKIKARKKEAAKAAKAALKAEEGAEKNQPEGKAPEGQAGQDVLFYECGTAEIYCSKRRPSVAASEFGTYSLKGKVEVRYAHQRYFEDEDEGGATLAPRDYGIMMHQAMEQATTREDIEQQIELRVIDGTISAEEAEIVRHKIASSLADPEVARWFDGSWDRVRMESAIISPGDTRRPDRVMTRGEEAVVVDYKFGLAETEQHRKQVASYAALLRQMGYTKVSGYLWYITLGKVVKVEQ